MLYDSLHQKLLPLGDSVMVYPAHGAGSLCGKNMRAERSSTIGTERLTNYALQIKSKEEFVAQLTSHLPARPEYFAKDAEINRTGATALAELAPLRAIGPAELEKMLREGELALDVRPERAVRRGTCSRLRQHRPLRAICFVGWNGAGFERASGIDRRDGSATRRGAAPTGTRRHRGPGWISRGRRCCVEAGRV